MDSSEKELIRGEKVGIFDLGACEVARSLQARLAGLHGFYDRVSQRGGVEKIIKGCPPFKKVQFF